jgi:tRNA pseudouridine38-40 synthase
MYRLWFVNYKLTLQYDGTDFQGWQIQDGQRTVQGELTRALALLEGRGVVVHGSGRTDAGVHAEGQVASVKLQRAFAPERLRAALNGNLPRDARVFAVEIVPDDFHARFSACGKTYLYRVLLGPVVSPFWRRYAHQEGRPLDVGKMQKVAQMLLGTHDWTAFANAQTDAKSRVRTVTGLSVSVQEESRAYVPLLEIRASADGFLRYMVRSLAGTLLAVGRNEIDEETICRALTQGTRSLAGATAPPHGLTLLAVHYSQTAL